MKNTKSSKPVRVKSKMKSKSLSTTRSLKNKATLRLPKDYPWKVLGDLANDLRQYLSEDDYELIETIVRLRDFDAYLILSEEWGLQSMALTVDVSLVNMRARYLLASLLKKFRFDSNSKAREDAALRKFILAELSCRSFNRKRYKELSWSEDETTRNVFTHALRWIQETLGGELPSEGDMTLWSRHGPGATTSTVNGRNAKYFKNLDWPYDCTVQALGSARTLIESDERWLGALEDSYRRRFNIPTHLILNRRVFWENVFNIVPGNKITFVPKSSLIDRTIAIEPTMNLYLQLGVDGFIRKRLKRWSIDLDDQSKNQRMARLGSQNDDDESLVTLDLAAASDTISLKLCKLLLPPAWYTYLVNLRSPVGICRDHTFKYEKISSMGNGYTFALETLIFAALSYGVSKELTGTADFRKIAVYGDDIIVPKNIATTLVEVLQCAGFALNLEKSFLKGPIRESCGADWFRGKPVRPIFISTKPTMVKELFTDLNRLTRHLELRFGMIDSKVKNRLLGWVPSSFKELYGPYSNEDFDSYIHHSGSGLNRVWKHGYWSYRRLISRPILYDDNRLSEFHFRKLSCSLRSLPITERLSITDALDRSHRFSLDGLRRVLSCVGDPVVRKWERKSKSGGSDFDVPVRKDSMLALTNSATSEWLFEYAE